MAKGVANLTKGQGAEEENSLTRGLIPMSGLICGEFVDALLFIKLDCLLFYGHARHRPARKQIVRCWCSFDHQRNEAGEI